VRRWRSRASADDGREVARVLESLAQSQVHLGVGDRGETKTSLGGIVQVRAHRGEVDERHGDESRRRLALRGDRWERGRLRSLGGRPVVIGG
jgi:hypothetical protein